MTNTHEQIIRVLLADDHEIFLDGLQAMLQKQAGVEVVGLASDGAECVRLAEQLHPDIILTDMMMPVMNGIIATRLIAEKNTEVGIIALSMSDQEDQIVEMLEAGARGYLLKNAHKSEIMDAIHTVYLHEPYYCRSTTTRLAKLIGKSRFNLNRNRAPVEFSEREKKIIHMICEEKSTKEIAAILFMGVRTVDGYRTAILEKMDVKNVAGMVVYAVKNKIYVV